MNVKDQLEDLEKKVTLGLKKAYLQMVEFKSRKNSPIIVSINGKVKAVPAHKVLDKIS
ncbi:MAG: hypothetical protein KDC79_06535 [Cyclobacteriaceae bacterium]|nr:hypothetical protein [Cyclobacteriaceae bacterium]